jgi:hypothetical protein
MEKNDVMLYGELLALNAELEGMKLQNEIDKEAGRELTYPPDRFFAVSDNIRSTMNAYR